jgi:serine/threonine-protein kinase
LDKVVPRLLLRVSGEVASAKQQVILDGRRTEAKDWGTPIAVDPGTHKVRSMAEDGNSWESEVSVPAGGTVSLDIPLLRPRSTPAPAPGPTPSPVVAPTPAPAPAPDAPKDADPGKAQRIAGLVVGGVGIVGLGVGAIFGLKASSKQSESNNSSDPQYCNADDKCGPTGLSLRDSALGSATASTVFFVIGGLAVAGGAVMFFTAPKAKPTTGLVVAPSLGGLVARGAF